MTQAKENGHEIWCMECKKPVYGRFAHDTSKLDLVRVQELRWDRSCTEPAGEYKCFSGRGNENHEFGTGFSYV
jgi:hypothetical protein